jgi:hypothetical protein
LDSIIEEEAMAAIDQIKLLDGQDMLINQNFNVAISNIIWRITGSKRFNVSVTYVITEIR